MSRPFGRRVRRTARYVAWIAAVFAVAGAAPAPPPLLAGSAAATPTYPAWSRVPDQPALASSSIVAVAAGPGRYVAVGSTIREDGQSEGAAWVSSTGTTWRRATRPPAGGVGVIRDRLGYVAWGSGGGGAAVWLSADGSTWGPAIRLPGSASAGLSGVARVGGSLVAVGSVEVPSDDVVPWEPRTWTSRDGRAWRAVTPVFSTRQRVMFYGVTSWRDSAVAWGIVIDPAAAIPHDSERAATFRSTDGRHWTIGTLFPRGTYTRNAVRTLACDSRRLVAIGALDVGDAGSPPPTPAAWTSTDGLRWTRAAGQPPSAGLAVWDGRRFVAVGPAATWTSPDGRRWTRVSSAPDAEGDGYLQGCTGGMCPRTDMSGIAAGSSGLVVVGTSRADDGLIDHGVVWVAPTLGS